MNRLHLAAALALVAAVAAAEPSYTGYSGAPGTSGTCAGSCHGSSGGTIEVVGFPVAYEAGQSYLISVVHRGGSSVSNFNASVRIGSGSQTAGTITAAYQTATYNTGSEPNGVHLSGSNQDSCTFNWQAPDPAVGEVKLYLAGHQGSYSGANTDFVLTASQATGVSDGPARLFRYALSVEPAVASGSVRIRFAAPAGTHPKLFVISRDGRVAARISPRDPWQPIIWQPFDGSGHRLAGGSYLVVLRADTQRLVRKLVLK